MMKVLFFISVFIFVLTGSVNTNTTELNTEISNTDSFVVEKPNSHNDFEFSYMFTGFGYNEGEMFSVLKVVGNHYIHTKEQDSSLIGKIYNEPKFVSEGFIRETSIDSILEIIHELKDSLVYRVNDNFELDSGGIHTISIRNDSTNVKFMLHNVSDSSALKLIEIINSNLPNGFDKLWLFEFPIDYLDYLAE